MRHLLVICFAVVALWCSHPPALADPALWSALKSGRHVGLMRHALAPGIGDPENFDLTDCATQRNLSEVGRQQARQTGDYFRQNGIAAAQVYASQWCRCQETARLLALGEVADLPVANSFFQQRDRREIQTAALRAWIGEQPLTDATLVVTHQVNIAALTGQSTGSGDMLVVRRQEDGSLEVVGRLTFPVP